MSKSTSLRSLWQTLPPLAVCFQLDTFAALSPMTRAHLTHVIARLALTAQPTDSNLTVAPSGRLERVQLQRWGNPDGEAFRAWDIGDVVETEVGFAGSLFRRTCGGADIWGAIASPARASSFAPR